MAKKKAGSSKSTNSKSSQSKTDAIRAELRTTKNGSPSLVAKKLNARGIKVTPQYVSTIKAADKRKAESGIPNRKPGRPVGSGIKQQAKLAASGNGAPEDLKEASDLMLKAVELVLKAGAKEARQLVNVAESMVERINNDQ